MEIKKEAIAGSLESSDVMIRVLPSKFREIELNSTVKKQFGDQILETVDKVLNQLEVQAIKLIINDYGALDYVLQARLKTAILRACEAEFKKEML